MSTIDWFVEAGDIPESIFFPPQALTSLIATESKYAPVNVCPATNSLRKQFYSIKSPWDLSLAVRLTKSGAELAMNPNRTSINSALAANYVSLLPRKDWRAENRPIIQIFVPYVFVPGDDLRVSQYPAFQHWFGERRPGIVISGEFRAVAWPRPLAFAFEWFDLTLPLTIKRGEPLFYVSFSVAQNIDVKLRKVEKSDGVSDQQSRIGGVAAHVKNTTKIIKQESEARTQDRK